MSRLPHGSPSRRQSTPRRPTRAVLALVISALVVPLALAGAPAGDSLVARFTAGESGIVRGVTLDAWGRALEGVRILIAPASADADSRALWRTSSDQTGRFLLSGLAPGEYRLVAMKGGYSVLVGRVDTLVQSSIDLVLYPAGHEVLPPGAQPADGSWSLRLPQRDRLEDADPLPLVAAQAAPAPAPASLPFQIEFEHARDSLGGASDEVGYDVRLGGIFDLDGLGLLEVRAGHRTVGSQESAHDLRDDVDATWIFGGDTPQVTTRLALDASRHERTLDTSSSELFERAEGVREVARLGASQSRLLTRGELFFDADLAYASGSQRLSSAADIEDDTLSYGVAAGLDAPWGRAHRAHVRLALRDVSDAPSQGTALDDVLVAGVIEPRYGLEGALGSIAEMTIDDAWTASDRLVLHTRVRTAHAGAARDAWTTSSALGLTWDVRSNLALHAEGGVVGGGERSGDLVWALALEKAGSVFSGTITRERAIAASDWAWQPGGFGPASLFVTGRDTLADRWRAEARVTPGGAWPSFALRAALAQLEGQLAANLPGDVPVVPVAVGGEADERSVLLEIAYGGSGTTLELVWEEIDDRSAEPALLGSAASWERRGVSVRQQIGLREWWGARCFLLLAYSENDVASSPAATSGTGPAPVAARLALLQQRRISGGVAVAF